MSSYKGFYEDLALWGVLTIGKDQKVNPRPTIWQRFLDDLCHMCDTKPGGKTVVSVAVSEDEDGIRCFWVSANNKPATAGRQLKRILYALARISNSSRTLAENIQSELLDFVVRKSASRVRNYMRQLQQHIAEADALQHDCKVEPCLEAFRKLLAIDDYPEVSIRAYGLRSTKEYFKLKELIRRKPDISAYRHIRHYLGRLASWAKTMQFVVDATKTHHLLTRRMKVRCVQSPCSISLEDLISDETALQALVAALTRAGVSDAREMCQARWRPLLDHYSRRWKSLSIGTTVHAEVTMLDHFYRRKLVFAYGKRYIGCSKPSCFCCGIYMSHHPLQPQERPRHNNVWVQWSPPGLKSEEPGDQPKTIDATIRVLAGLTGQKIQEEMSQGQVTIGQRVFDSVTDISASLPTVFDSSSRYH